MSDVSDQIDQFIQAKLEKLSGHNLSPIVEAGAKLIANDAKLNVPVDIGTLRDAIGVDVREVTETSATAVIGVDKIAPYGADVEYGTGIYASDGNGRQTPWVYYYEGRKGAAGFRFTHGNRPQPYLRPAFDNNRDKVADFVKSKAMELLK